MVHAVCDPFKKIRNLIEIFLNGTVVVLEVVSLYKPNKGAEAAGCNDAFNKKRTN